MSMRMFPFSRHVHPECRFHRTMCVILSCLVSWCSLLCVMGGLIRWVWWCTVGLRAFQKKVVCHSILELWLRHAWSLKGLFAISSFFLGHLFIHFYSLLHLSSSPAGKRKTMASLDNIIYRAGKCMWHFSAIIGKLSLALDSQCFSNPKHNRCRLWKQTHGRAVCLQPAGPIQSRLWCDLEVLSPLLQLMDRGSTGYSQRLDFHGSTHELYSTSAFPSQHTLSRVVLAQLEQFVESDYTVVMFSGGALYRPGWRWLFKAYRSLNRR